MSVTGRVSNKVTDATWAVSDEVNKTEEVLEENIESAGSVVIDGIQTMSLFGNLMKSVTEDEPVSSKQEEQPLSKQEERLAKYGDPSASIRKESDEPVNPYDYPKALRKYL